MVSNKLRFNPAQDWVRMFSSRFRAFDRKPTALPGTLTCYVVPAMDTGAGRGGGESGGESAVSYNGCRTFKNW